MDVQEYFSAKAKLNNIADEISDKEANKLIDLALKVKKHEETMFASANINWNTVAACTIVAFIFFILTLIFT
jgi:hypothetical protein